MKRPVMQLNDTLTHHPNRIKNFGNSAQCKFYRKTSQTQCITFGQDIAKIFR